MSLLFDRLCELAVAERVEVVIFCDTTERTNDGSLSIAEVLARAAAAPQLGVTILPITAAAPLKSLARNEFHCIDVREAGDAINAIQRMTITHRRRNDAVIVARDNTVALQVGNSLEFDIDRWSQETNTKWVVVSDKPDFRGMFERLTRRGLGVAVGGAETDAGIRVDDLPGVVAIVDALVTLRTAAFGATTSQ